MTLYHQGSEAACTLSKQLAATWQRELGIRVTLTPKAFEAHLHCLAAGKYQMSLSRYALRGNDPVSALVFLLPARDPNASPCQSERYREWLLQRVSTTASAVERLALAQEANLLLAEAPPCIPLWYSTATYLINPQVGGWDHRNATQCFYAKDLYLKQASGPG